MIARRNASVVAMALVALLWSTTTAQATVGHFSEVGQASHNGGLVVGYGTKAQLNVYAKPSPEYADWVNSLYAGTSSGTFYEAGYFWTPSDSSPTVFSHYFDGYVHQERWLNQSLTVGTKPTFQIQNMGGGDTYMTYVNGALKDAWSWTGIKSSCPCVGAERYDTRDPTLKGQFLYTSALLKNSSGYYWSYWSDGFANADSDPRSYVWFNYVRRSDHYVYVDDHQN